MRCWRIDLRRSFSPYLDGELEPDKIKRIENHLIECGPCRTSLARLRGGQRFASQMPRFKPQRDPWGAIEAAIEKEEATPAAQVAHGWRGQLSKPAYAIGVAGVLIVGLLVAGAVISRHFSPEQEARGLMEFEALDRREFHTVTIADIDRNTKPHIVAEGYVSQVGVNDEDGDYSFKLVEDLQQPGPFIICEIIDPIKFAPPRVGSRVRVYGVSRYDGQDNHNWYEVHPVLNIEVMQ
ncbi:MAG TPA: zf-HC2 domain-containing protein [Blastocatellia bacterium]|nr:zf-HC2 domain-containing protein [Blastocatellia bacterium]